MADKNQAIQLTLKHEGGYVNNPHDSGGATNFGITQADMPGRDMRTITAAEAANYFDEHYWKPLYSQINEQNVANKLFDMGVLAGVGVAVKLLQRALGFPRTEVDGDFGPYTLSAVNEANPATLLAAYHHLLDTHYEAVVASHPEDSIFLKGWENRVAL